MGGTYDVSVSDREEEKVLQWEPKKSDHYFAHENVEENLRGRYRKLLILGISRNQFNTNHSHIGFLKVSINLWIKLDMQHVEDSRTRQTEKNRRQIMQNIIENLCVDENFQNADIEPKFF